MRFQNKVALITGARRGIGKATALAFARERAKVVVNHSRSEDEANTVVAEIKKLGSEAVAVEADVSKEAEVEAMVEQVIKRFGRLDVLVNNAGVVFDVPFMEKTVEQWNKTLGVNLVGPFLCSKYCAPHLRKTKGRIINISSTNGIYSMHPESTDYDASKAGLIAFTKGLAQELAPDVLVNSIAPGWINTKMNAELPKDFVEKENERIWLIKRFGEPSEIANAVLFLASDEATYVNGTTLVVDGGYV